MEFDLLKILCFWAVVIIFAGIVSRLARRNFNRQDWNLAPHTRLRLRQGASVFHCNLLEITKKGWKVSAPISQSEVVPLRPSDCFMVDFTTETGVGTFFTQVLYRENGKVPCLIVKAPTKVRFLDRRGSPRVTLATEAILNRNQACEILDMGMGGAKIVSPGWMMPGDAIRLEYNHELFEGWVLACEPASTSGHGFKSRLRFRKETPLEKIFSMSTSPDG